MENRRIRNIIIILAVVILSISVSQINANRRAARKLVKLILAASLFAPPGIGVVPIPLPLPIPFAIDTFKPPIIHPHPLFLHHHHLGGIGGFGGFGGGFGHGIGHGIGHGGFGGFGGIGR